MSTSKRTVTIDHVISADSVVTALQALRTMLAQQPDPQPTDEPLQIEISADYAVIDEHGNEITDEPPTVPWMATAGVYCRDVIRATHDQSIDGSHWEISDGTLAYSMVSWGGKAGEYPADAMDALIERLERDGYEVTID